MAILHHPLSQIGKGSRGGGFSSCCGSCGKRTLYGFKRGFGLGRDLKKISFYTDLFLTSNLSIGDRFLYHKDYDQALSCYEKILRCDPGNQDVWDRINQIEALIDA